MLTNNFSTRMECIDWLLKELAEKEKARVPTLGGFDFTFGYPAGYLKVLGLTKWRDLLEYYAARVTDSKNNQHNRDDFARRVNQQLGRAPGPFWGVARSGACDLLQTRRVGRFTFPYRVGEIHLAEFRHTENAARASGTIPQSVWKLNQGVAVGGQVIMGLPCLHKLLTKLNSIKAWPFETGWKVEPEIVIHLAEIFPSLISIDKYAAQIASQKMCRDEAQVRACCEFAYELDSQGQFKDYFKQPMSVIDDMRLAQYVEKEEGWILWSNLHEDN